MAPNDVAIRHEPSNQRLLTSVDGKDAFLEYRLQDDVMVITHTQVPMEIGGRGIAGQLVGEAFELARRFGWMVNPQCSYAAAWAERHQEVADLVI
jgi:predicted GNAT family acetyltransferase